MTRLTADWLNAPASQKVCAMLIDAGYQAWFVGGCVRNALMNAPVADLDLSTDALPEQVLALASALGLKSVATGFDHGTVTVIADDSPFEITTFRRDIATDGRRAVVAFSHSIADDARRRDFTMNALYAAPDGTVADPLGGLPDLIARRVRFIEDADARITEDYLRILRFFRFHAWYGDPVAGIDAEGLAACAEHIEGIQALSRERVGQEMLKLLSAPDPAPAVASMAATGALAQILPGANHAALSILVHIESTLKIAPDPMRRLACIGGMNVDASLRLSNDQAKVLKVMRSALAAGPLGYHYGAQAACDALIVRSASLSQELDPNELILAKFGSQQTFPLLAADLMPQLSGPALGAALREAEARWIKSDFTLTKAELLG